MLLFPSSKEENMLAIVVTNTSVDISYNYKYYLHNWSAAQFFFFLYFPFYLAEEGAKNDK